MKFLSQFDETHTVCGLWFILSEHFFYDLKLGFFLSFAMHSFQLCNYEIESFFPFRVSKEHMTFAFVYFFFVVKFKLRFIFQYGWYHDRNFKNNIKNIISVFCLSFQKNCHTSWNVKYELAFRPYPPTNTKPSMQTATSSSQFQMLSIIDF